MPGTEPSTGVFLTLLGGSSSSGGVTLADVEQIRDQAVAAFGNRLTKTEAAVAAVSAQYPAGEDLPGHTIVRLVHRQLFVATPDADPTAILGMIRDATPQGQQATVTSLGTMNGFGTLVPGARYFIGANGKPSLQPPTLPGQWCKIIGVAQDEDSMLIRAAAVPIQLAANN